MSQQQTIKIPEILQDFFACRIVSAANHQYPEKTQRLIGLQNCLSRKSSVSRKDSKTFSPAELSYQQIINIPEIFEEFFASRIVLAAKHQYPGNIQRLFRLQNCTSSISSVTRKNPKTSSPAELSQPQIVSIPKILKVFFACRIVLAANPHYTEHIQSLFRLQKGLSSKPSKSRKYSKIFSPAELSRPQIINIPKKLKDLLACRVVLAASHQYPGKIQRLFRPQNCPISKSSIPRNYSKIFCLQKCLSRKSSISRKYPKTSSPAELSQQQIVGFPKYAKTFSPAELSQLKIINIRELFKNFFCLQNCRSRKSPISRKYSKAFSPAEQYQEQVIKIPEIFKDFFACRIVLAANRQFPENTQSLFRLQNCLGRKSSISRKNSKTYWPAELSQPQVISIPERFKDFFARRIVLSANHQYPGNIQRLFACRNVLAANNQYPGNIQRLLRLQNCLSSKSSVSRNMQRFFRLQNCLSRKSSVSRKYSKSFSPAELSQPQVISIPERFKDFFARRIVLSANHQYPGNIQRLFCLQKCLSRKSSISRKYPKTSSPAELSQRQIIGFPKNAQTFSPAELSQPKIINIRELFKNFFCLQNCCSRKSPISRKYSKAFQPAEQYQEQVIKIPEIFKDFFACRIVLTANRQYPENTQSLFRLQNCLSRKSSVSRKDSKTFSPAELSYQQIINIPEIFEEFFASRIVLAANHQYPGIIQRLFRLQNCTSSKSSISRKKSKTLLPAKLSQPQIIIIPETSKDVFACRIVLVSNHHYPENTQSLFRLQNCLTRKSSISRKYSKIFSSAEMSQPQIINIPKILENFFACRFVLAANH